MKHDETGHITEDLIGTAPAMMQKRLAKVALLKKEVAPLKTYGVDQARGGFCCLGSTRQAILEAWNCSGQEAWQRGLIHFTELWPLPVFQFPKNKRYWSWKGMPPVNWPACCGRKYGLECLRRDRDAMMACR